MKVRLKSCLFLFVLLVSFSQAAFATTATHKQADKPKKLVLAITDNGSGKRVEAIKPIAEYLSRELQMEVITTTARQSGDLLDMMANGSVNIGFINSFGYVLGISDSLPIAPLVVTGNAGGQPSSYNSCIFTSVNSGIKSMDDFLSKAETSSFMFVNPTSTSGHLVPRLYLKKAGIVQAETGFRELIFGNNHYNTLEKVLAGEADAGAMAYNILQAKLESGEIKKEEVNILWISEPITQTPAILDSRLDPELQQQIQKALLELHQKDPELWKHVQKNFSAHDATNFVIARDEHYNSIRNISGSIEDLIFILNYYTE